jgi:DNA-binding beta-propeller fold protein YncE
MQVGRWCLARWVVGAVALLVVMCALASTAVADESGHFEYIKAFGPDGTDLTEFEDATSVAVDYGINALYVLDRKTDVLYKFDPEGNPVDFSGVSPNISGNELSGLSISDFPGSGARQLAVDPANHTIYLPDKDVPLEYGASVLKAFEPNGEPHMFTAGPGAGTNEIPGFEALRGIAVDTHGNIYTTQFSDESGVASGARLKIFAPSGGPILERSLLSPGAITVDKNGVIYYLANSTEVVRLTPSEQPITSSTTFSQSLERVDPNYASGLAVDPLLNRLFVAENPENPISQMAVYDEEGALQQNFAGPGEPGELDHPSAVAAGGNEKDGLRVYVSQNANGGDPQVKIFKEELCVCPPNIELEAATEITNDSAALKAKINPNNLETTYWWEYGTEDCAIATCTKVPVDGAEIGDGRKGVVVTQMISGLDPQTVYFYRVVAENEEGTTPGDGKHFMTQGPMSVFVLGDARAWEMVSPPTKFAGIPYRTNATAIQAAESGDGLVYASFGPITDSPAGNRLPSPATLLAKRSSDGTWSSEDLSPPHTSNSALASDTEFKIFSPDLSRAAMEPTDATPLSDESTEKTPYLWSDGEPPFFTPLLTASNVAPGTEIASNNVINIEGADPSLGHVILNSSLVPLIEGAANGSVYMWHDGALSAVSQLPEQEGGEVVKAILGSGLGSVRHALSDDATRVFWAPTPGSKTYDQSGVSLPALYLRDMEAEETVRLDVPNEGASGTGPEQPAFNIASADGSVVFFTDSQQLTADASPEGRDLYRCEIGVDEGSLGCVELTDISAPLTGSGESAEVLDQVSAASNDGSHIYFVARGVLDKTSNGAGASAKSGKPNLYLWEEGQGVSFIGTLSEKDFPVWGGQEGLSLGFASFISATTSPNGRYFAFTSEEGLTGDQNQNSGGASNTEVFLYDAEATGNPLTCLSCNPFGAAAVGERLPAIVELFPPDPNRLWAGRQVAATLPEAIETRPNGRSLYRPRAVLDNGRVFFNSADPLVPGDSNGNWDVYQYEPIGLGGCEASTHGASEARSGSGCVGLISSGSAEGDAGFLDATPDGNDVFFLTQGRLSVLDKDNEVDVYDARVGGVTATVTPDSECSGEGCRSAGTQPIHPSPGSEAFHGSQRPLHCRKGQRKVRRHSKTVCVRKKHKKHHHKKRAGKDRRVGP